MKKLTRSKSNKVISGVIGGLGEYLSIDANILRIGYVFFSFFTPFPGLLIYILASIIIPSEKGYIYEDEEYKDNTGLILGLALIIFGSILLAQVLLPMFNIHIPNFYYYFKQLRQFWPVFLILLGIFIIINQRKS